MNPSERLKSDTRDRFYIYTQAAAGGGNKPVFSRTEAFRDRADARRNADPRMIENSAQTLIINAQQRNMAEPCRPCFDLSYLTTHLHRNSLLAAHGQASLLGADSRALSAIQSFPGPRLKVHRTKRAQLATKLSSRIALQGGENGRHIPACYGGDEAIHSASHQRQRGVKITKTSQ